MGKHNHLIVQRRFPQFRFGFARGLCTIDGYAASSGSTITRHDDAHVIWHTDM
jgi:hypothetical protein